MLVSITTYLQLALTCSAQQECTKITCGTNTDSICYSYADQVEPPTATSSKCASGYYCPFNFTDFATDYYCTPEPEPSVTTNQLPGEKCNSTLQCNPETGATCTKSYCVGAVLGGPCQSSSDCNPGLYCYFTTESGTCQALLPEKSVCGYGECTYGYSCNFGVCQKMFSLLPGAYYDRLLSSSVMCSTGEGYRINATFGLCITRLKNIEAYDKPCTTCTGVGKAGSVEESLNLPCECGLGGQSYCPGFDGDEYGSKKFRIEKSYLLGKDVKKCNIKTGMRCLYSFGSKSTLWEYAYYSWLDVNRWRYIGADSCLYKQLDRDYVYIKHMYDDATDGSSELAMVCALIFSLIA